MVDRAIHIIYGETAMRFQSPLSNLCDVLIQIKDSAKQYNATLEKNEASTRAVLIDPVLRSLGWDIANTHMVEVERTINKVRADYTLQDSNAAPRIVVEAKSLGTKLDQQDFVMSLVQYAFNFQVNDVFLTDGLIWQHFNEFQPQNLKPVKILDIVNDDPVLCAAYLVQQLDAARFWSVGQDIDALSQRIEQLESTVATLQKNMLNTIATAPPTTMIQTGLPSNNSSFSTTINITRLKFVDLNILTDLTNKRPSHLRLPDSSVLSVKRWKDVLRECCKFVLANNNAISLPLPDRAARKVSLISTIKPAPGISYVSEQYNGKTIFIYTNYDANNSVSNAIYVLSKVLSINNKVTAAVVLES